jgi:hypothetical protein
VGDSSSARLYAILEPFSLLRDEISSAVKSPEDSSGLVAFATLAMRVPCYKQNGQVSSSPARVQLVLVFH